MDRRQKIVSAAAAGIGCSSILNISVYMVAVVRLADRVPRMKSFYFGNPKLSTCALFALQCLSNAGCTQPECTAPYFPEGGVERNAMVDIQTMARRSGAWVPAFKAMPPLKMGDVWIIDNAVGDAHTGVCTSDAIVQSDGSWLVETAEGGQEPVDAQGRAVGGQGSSAVKGFAGANARHIVWNAAIGKWMMGQRWLIGYASADALPVPDDNPESSGQHVGPTVDQIVRAEATTVRELPLPFDPTSIPPPPPNPADPDKTFKPE